MMSSAPVAGEEPILVELASVGYPSQSLADLRDSGTRYRRAIPVLLRWLPQITDPRVTEQVVRALSVPWARPAAVGPLIQLFRTVKKTVDPTGLGLRWTIGNALEVLFDDENFDGLVDIAKDRRYGRSREMVVLGLGKSKRPEVASVLMELIRDPDVDGHALKALGRLKDPSAREAFESKLDDRRAWVRREARKALSGLDR